MISPYGTAMADGGITVWVVLAWRRTNKPTASIMATRHDADVLAASLRKNNWQVTIQECTVGVDA